MRQHLVYSVGIGYDVHPLKEGVPLVLGGLILPWSKGLAGHSDGDVILHAIIDALLGAARLGDIGVHFPDSNPLYKGCSSVLLLKEVIQKLNREGYEVNNVDCTLVAQRPQIRPYVQAMRENISKASGADPDQISVKATTTEHLGFAGREEGMACYAVCSIRELNSKQ
ncbi:MAG: 2-C-methyl-D-erythritol 2,4-cyclodiphosphate synthase [Clostridiales bacterium]|nr:2-C-methyl-D-erythritol 2,4-cyclodiphosphate synthase [Clostridiales bacterium]MCL2166896.1 2-C-methyl-D-erythritol 2,4-cyclodiphosphate synthase [Clostridiales bacterium]